MKINGGGMNMNTFKSSYAMVNNIEEIPRKREYVKKQRKPKMQCYANDNLNIYRIHSNQAS